MKMPAGGKAGAVSGRAEGQIVEIAVRSFFPQKLDTALKDGFALLGAIEAGRVGELQRAGIGNGGKMQLDDFLRSTFFFCHGHHRLQLFHGFHGIVLPMIGTGGKYFNCQILRYADGVAAVYFQVPQQFSPPGLPFEAHIAHQDGARDDICGIVGLFTGEGVSLLLEKLHRKTFQFVEKEAG